MHSYQFADLQATEADAAGPGHDYQFAELPRAIGHHPNQLYPEFLSFQNLNMFSAHDSASRKQMFAGNMPQVLSLLTPTRRKMVTGTEREYGKHCFVVKMPVDARIINTFERIPRGVGRSALRNNPETYVFYENVDTGEYDYMVLPSFRSLHKRFGFEFVYDEEARAMLQPKAYIKKGTVFARPRTLTKDGEYMYGREARTAFMTLPAVIEDGAIVSESFANSMATLCYEERVISCGKDSYGLNLYGDPNIPGDYRMFPDIGMKVREDGLVFASRTYNEETAAVEMTPERLRQVEHFFDKPVRATPGSEVVDVLVQHNPTATQINQLPADLCFSPERYDRAHRRFLEQVLELGTYLEGLHKKESQQNTAPFSKKLNRFLADALVYLDPKYKERRELGYKRVKLEHWRVTLVLKERILPGMGIKITDTHGGKGVICKVMRDEDMPRDEFGHVLDLVMDPMSITKRMNMGRPLELRINSCTMQLTRDLRLLLGLPDKDFDDEFTIARYEKLLHELSKDKFDAIRFRLLSYYQIVTPPMFNGMLRQFKTFNWHRHIATQLAEGIQLWIPTNNPVSYPEVVKALKEPFPEMRHHLSWRLDDGTPKTSKKKILVGSLYIILLEKIGRDFAAVASAKLQINGVPSRINNSDRNANPVRPQPVRIMGETEVRLSLMAAGGEATRDLLEMSNNPESHAQAIESILLADYPTNLEEAVDRSRFPADYHRILQQIKHLHECGGIEHYYRPD